MDKLNVQEVARQILAYYSRNRRKGHTRAVVQDARSTRAIVIVAEDVKDKPLRMVRKNHVLTLAQVQGKALEDAKLQGFPLVRDDSATQVLLSGLMDQTKSVEKPVKVDKADKPVKAVKV
ncbi:MAG: hypothetical protein M0R06_05615 [Sphaerochaeta sp.]|jgi:hypothetical protein|nr:hypothetical protein [Sphaerochaeta sp.]